MARNSSIQLNFLPVRFSARHFQGSVLPYEGEEKYYELRDASEATHCFRRNGDTIECVPLSDSSEKLGKPQTFDVQENFQLANVLIRRAVREFLVSKGSTISSLSPLSVVRRNQNLLPRNDVLGLYPEYSFDSRSIVPHSAPKTSGLVIDFSGRYLIHRSVAALIERGLDPTDLYVQSNDSDIPALVHPQFGRKLVGRVASQDGDELILTDSRVDRISADACYLEASTTNVNLLLELLSLSPDLHKLLFRITGAERQVERLRKLRGWLGQDGPFHCTPDLSFSVANQMHRCSYGNDPGNHRVVGKPKCVLRPGGSITVSWPVDPHIDANGPYDTESFPTKRVQIAVVFPQELQGETEVFLRKLERGVNSARPFSQGFVRKYRLSSCNFDLFPVKRRKALAESFREASIEALRNPYDLALVIMRDSFLDLTGVESPYLVSKATFMAQGIPVQMVRRKSLRARSLPYVLNNLALALYAKLGGVPWVLSSEPTLTNEIVFGIGSARLSDGRLTEDERVVGITTVFSGDGHYLLSNSTREVRNDDYLDALRGSLSEALRDVSRRLGWQPREKVRLIFHQSFKRYRRQEAEAVKQFVAELTDYHVEYAFVHVSAHHNWKLFDLQSRGVRGKGAQVPSRGRIVPLGPHTTLLSLTGPDQLKTKLQGCPSPVLVSVHEDSTFKSQEYLANQVYKFTFLSWRTFFPATLPVSIYYSNLIASLLGKLRPLPNWNSDIIRTKLRDKRWFL